MAKNVLSLQLLRNSQIVADKAAAISAIQASGTNDGVIKLARYYTDETSATTKTVFGIYHAFENGPSGYTIYDADHDQIAAIEAKIGTGETTLDEVVEMLGDGFNSGHTVADAIDEVDDKLGSGVTSSNTVSDQFDEIDDKLGSGVTTANSVTEQLEEINDKLGTGVTTANSVSDQLEALSGDPSTATSADTSVEGAKKYTDDKIATLDYADTAVAKKFVTEVDETDGVISVSRGEITSTGKTITLTDGADGGVNFEVNIDGQTIVKDANGVLSVANSALIEYVGDDRTINVSAADANNKKTISTLLTLSAVTPSSTTVKEEYALVDASGTTKGETIKIYKDSSLVSIEYITDTGDTHYQNLKYVYVDNSGNTQTEYVDMSALVLEAEFASGVTFSNGVAHGVVDANSEKDSQSTPVDFLTVGADGFKISGIKDEIDRKIAALDATGGTQTVDTGKHVAVEVVEADGKITAVTVTEDDIASATALAELSAKTVTELESSNSSITVSSAATAEGTVKYDVITDASKIQMSGFTAAESGFTAIAESSSVTEAFKAVETYVLDNEAVVSAALNDLETTKLDNIVVNGVTGTVNSNIATVTIGGADVALTGYQKPASGTAIVASDDVNTAIGKLEAKLDDATAGGLNGVDAGSGITASALASNRQTITAKLSDPANLSGIDENAIKFDSTAQGMYIEYIDAGTY